MKDITESKKTYTNSYRIKERAFCYSPCNWGRGLEGLCESSFGNTALSTQLILNFMKNDAEYDMREEFEYVLNEFALNTYEDIKNDKEDYKTLKNIVNSGDLDKCFNHMFDNISLEAHFNRMKCSVEIVFRFKIEPKYEWKTTIVTPEEQQIRNEKKRRQVMKNKLNNF